MPRGHRDFLISAVQFDAGLGTGSVSVLDLAPVAVTHGAQGVEYRDVYWKDKARELPAVREQVTRLKLKATYTTVTPLFSADPGAQAQLLRDIEDARALGSPLLRVNLGERPAPSSPKGPGAAAREAVACAARAGVALALENNARPPGERLADIKATLEEFNSPVLGTNIDFANYATTGQDPLEAIRALAPWIIYVHAKDARRDARGWTSTSLGAGSLPLKEIMAALDETGRTFLSCFEFPGEGDPEAAIAKSKAFLEAKL